jgi:hypothetical protein
MRDASSVDRALSIEMQGDKYPNSISAQVRSGADRAYYRMCKRVQTALADSRVSPFAVDASLRLRFEHSCYALKERRYNSAT